MKSPKEYTNELAPFLANTRAPLDPWVMWIEKIQDEALAEGMRRGKTELIAMANDTNKRIGFLGTELIGY